MVTIEAGTAGFVWDINIPLVACGHVEQLS